MVIIMGAAYLRGHISGAIERSIGLTYHEAETEKGFFGTVISGFKDIK
jgi:hypothetical protein